MQDNVNNLFSIHYIFFLSFFLLASLSGRYQYDSKAFLFSLVNKPGWAPVRLSQTGQYSSLKAYSIYFFSSYGPTFGGHDINIKSNASSNSNSYSNLGHTNSPPSGYSYRSTFAKTFPAGTYTFTPDEVETFYESTQLNEMNGSDELRWLSFTKSTTYLVLVNFHTWLSC